MKDSSQTLLAAEELQSFIEEIRQANEKDRIYDYNLILIKEKIDKILNLLKNREN